MDSLAGIGWECTAKHSKKWCDIHIDNFGCACLHACITCVHMHGNSLKVFFINVLILFSSELEEMLL